MIDIEITNETPLSFLTVRQFINLINLHVNKQPVKADERCFFGDKEIGSFFGRSVSTVQTWKKAGYFDLVKTDGTDRLSVKESDLRQIARENNLKIKCTTTK